jgi:type IV pilus assembly protein PilB
VGEVSEIEPEVISSIESDMARQYGIVPLYLSEGGIHFLAGDPFNSAIIDDLTFALNLEIQLIVCDPDYVTQLLDTYYPQEESSLNDLLGDVGLEDFEGLDETKENELSDAANETPDYTLCKLGHAASDPGPGIGYSF